MRPTELAHLARRWVIAVMRGGPSPGAQNWVRAQLTAGEWALWEQMSPPDRRHAVMVARRFVQARPGAARPEVVAALLHDVGKVRSNFGTTARVVATVMPPRPDIAGRGPVARWWRRVAAYHAHEALSEEMIRSAGGDQVTLALLRGEHPAAEALAQADQI